MNIRAISPLKECVGGSGRCCECEEQTWQAWQNWQIEVLPLQSNSNTVHATYLIIAYCLPKVKHIFGSFLQRLRPMCVLDSRRYICLMLYILKSHVRMLWSSPVIKDESIEWPIQELNPTIAPTLSGCRSQHC